MSSFVAAAQSYLRLEILCIPQRLTILGLSNGTDSNWVDRGSAAHSHLDQQLLSECIVGNASGVHPLLPD